MGLKIAPLVIVGILQASSLQAFGMRIDCKRVLAKPGVKYYIGALFPIFGKLAKSPTVMGESIKDAIDKTFIDATSKLSTVMTAEKVYLFAKSYPQTEVQIYDIVAGRLEATITLDIKTILYAPPIPDGQKDQHRPVVSLAFEFEPSGIQVIDGSIYVLGKNVEGLPEMRIIE